MSSIIKFIVKSEIYKSGKKIKLYNKYLEPIKDNICSYSRINCEGHIYSYKLGTINLIDKNVKKYNNDY